MSVASGLILQRVLEFIIAAMMSASISTCSPEVFFNKALESREFLNRNEVWVKSPEFELKNEPD